MAAQSRDGLSCFLDVIVKQGDLALWGIFTKLWEVYNSTVFQTCCEFSRDPES